MDSLLTIENSICIPGAGKYVQQNLCLGKSCRPLEVTRKGQKIRMVLLLSYCIVPCATQSVSPAAGRRLRWDTFRFKVNAACKSLSQLLLSTHESEIQAGQTEKSWMGQWPYTYISLADCVISDVMITRQGLETPNLVPVYPTFLST